MYDWPETVNEIYRGLFPKNPVKTINLTPIGSFNLYGITDGKEIHSVENHSNKEVNLPFGTFEPYRTTYKGLAIWEPRILVNPSGHAYITKQFLNERFLGHIFSDGERIFIPTNQRGSSYEIHRIPKKIPKKQEGEIPREEWSSWNYVSRKPPILINYRGDTIWVGGIEIDSRDTGPDTYNAPLRPVGVLWSLEFLEEEIMRAFKTIKDYEKMEKSKDPMVKLLKRTSHISQKLSDVVPKNDELSLFF